MTARAKRQSVVTVSRCRWVQLCATSSKSAGSTHCDRSGDYHQGTRYGSAWCDTLKTPGYPLGVFVLR